MILTYGHSTNTQDEANAALAHARVTTLVDIRSHPTTRWEWWQKGNIPGWLEVEYAWEPDLGGWTEQDLPLTDWAAGYGVDLAPYARGFFPKQRIGVPRKDATGVTWTNQGLYDYSIFTATARFLAGAARLVDRPGNSAIMCAESLWWKCHRSLVADYLYWSGHDVAHVDRRGKLTSHSRMVGNRLDRYHPDVLAAWKDGVR
jgi:hypothetical protein